MSRQLGYLGLAVAGLLMLTPNSRPGGCTLSHTECTYECTQYYPNGTDCKKTTKHCHTVCDEYDVKPSGDTPHRQPPRKSLMEDKSKKSGVTASTLSASPTPENGTFPLSGVVEPLDVPDSGPWILRLDAALRVSDQLIVNEVEVETKSTTMDQFKGHRVEALARLEWRKSSARGKYPTLILENMQLAKQ